MKKYLALLILLLPTKALSCSCVTTFLPTDSTTTIQCEVNTCSGGTTFTFATGTFRNVNIQSQPNDIFQGTLDINGNRVSILKGSNLLTVFISTNIPGMGAGYYAPNQFQQGSNNSGIGCQSGHPRCNYPEDLFFDGNPLIAESTTTGLSSGQWFFGYSPSTGAIYLVDNPAGHILETSVTEEAFAGPYSANGSTITVKNLVIAQYANPASIGAVWAPSGSAGTHYFSSWTVTNCEFYGNHWTGVYYESGDNLSNNYSHNNGADGFNTADASSTLVANNIITNNGYAGYSYLYGPAGLKIGGVGGAFNNTVASNTIANNNGVGLWDDVLASADIFNNNIIYGNVGVGISSEISSGTIISSNTLYGNATVQTTQQPQMYSAQILIYNTRGATISSNTIIVSSGSQNAIGLENDDRSSQGAGLVCSTDSINHNHISMFYTGTQQGGYTANSFYSMYTSVNNSFDYNDYHMVYPSTGTYFGWGTASTQSPMNFLQFQSLGQETHGTVDGFFPAGLGTISTTGSSSTISLSVGTGAINVK